MKFSITVSLNTIENAPALYEEDLSNFLSYLKSIGYDGIEIAFGNPDILNSNELFKRIRSHGLKVSAIQTGQLVSRGFNFSDPDHEIRMRSVQEIYKYVDIASVLKSPVIIGLIRGRNIPEQMNDSAYNMSKECIKNVCKYASNKNVVILIEPINRKETPIINTIEDAANFILSMGMDNVFMLIDSYHIYIEEPGTELAYSIKKNMGNIKYIHIADSERMPPGSGTYDLSYFIEAIKNAGFNGYISGEVKPIPDCYEAARKTYSFLRSNF
jgi:sugar phosphate isomerase/epimerase